MKRALLILTLLNITPLYATIPIEGWYATVFGGYSHVSDNISFKDDGLRWQDSVYYPGFDVGGNLGFKSTPMRYEGELTYLYANLKRFRVSGVSQHDIDGYSQGFFALANVYYDFRNLLNCLQPYLGLGIGYGWVSMNLTSHRPFGYLHNSGSNAVFAYQGTGGLLYNFAENWAFNLNLRYIATTHANQFGSIFQAQLANLGVVYRFDGNNYK